MTTKRLWILLALLSGSAAYAAQNAGTAEAFYKQAYTAESVDRDPAKAVTLYNKVLSQTADENPLAARAHLRIGICLEKLGRADDARRAYQDILDMAEAPAAIASQARDRLQRLQPVARAVSEDSARETAEPSAEATPAHSLTFFPSWRDIEKPGIQFEIGAYGGHQFGLGQLNSSLAALGSFGISFNRYFAIDLQGGYTPADESYNVFGTDVNIAHRLIASVELIPKVSIPIGAFRPYIEAGAGEFLLPNSGSDELTGFTSALNQLLVARYGPDSGFGSDDKINNALGGIFGGGVDIALTRHISLGIDVTYIYLRPWERTDAFIVFGDSPIALFQSTEGVRNLDMIRAVGGLKVHF